MSSIVIEKNIQLYWLQDMETKKQITQYFSKWQKCWVFFNDGFGNKRTASNAEIKEMTKFKYRLK